VIDNITKKGTIIYRAGSSAVRDDGERLAVSSQADRAAWRPRCAWRWNATASASPSAAGAATFAGIRQVEGQSLALLKRGEEVMVLPVDEPTARRLKRLAVGDAITVTPQGSIKTTKGRSR
jgi:hypothetical protein